MADLKTNYVDDKLDTSKNQLRKYNMITNDDGTVSFVDVTTYTTQGTSFGAKDINDTNSAINQLNTDLSALNESMGGYWLKEEGSNVATLGLHYNETAVNPDGTTGAFEIRLKFPDGTQAVLGFDYEHIWFNYYNNQEWENRWVK